MAADTAVHRLVVSACFALLATGCAGYALAPEVAPEKAAEIHADLRYMEASLRTAQERVAQATASTRIDELKAHVADVASVTWGMPIGITKTTPAANYPAWKSRWQKSFTDFDPDFAARYGTKPPAITDPTALGIVGRGRHVRRLLTSAAQPGSETQPLLEALNNVIGWMRVDDGVTKGERQPRIDLTYRWDAPKSFWQSEADTGWVFAVHSQAVNILKTNYAGDLQTARAHAAALQSLIERCLDGEGGAPGLRRAIEHAEALLP